MATNDTSNPEAALPPEGEQQAADQATQDAAAADANVQKSEGEQPEGEQQQPEGDATVDTEKAVNPAQAMALLGQIFKLLKPHFADGGKPGGGGGYPPPKKSKDAPTRKSLIGFTGDGELVLNADMIRELQDVQKAKAFTGKRAGVLTDAAKALLGVLGEVNPDAVKKLMESFGKVDVKPTKKSAEQEPDAEPADQTSLADTITAAVTKAMEPVDERLKALEGARGVPKSVDGDQTADVKKSNDSIWAGSAIGE